jgi:hypothetical protein
MARVIELAGQTMTLRDAGAEDVELIFPTWMEAARQLRQCNRAVFDQYYQHVVRALMETESAVVLTREGSDTIHAWACGRPPNLLHFAYVPFKLRRHGFGRAVIEAVLEGYPHIIYVTSSPLSIRDHRRFVYNPYVRYG